MIREAPEQMVNNDAVPGCSLRTPMEGEPEARFDAQIP